ncbi:MAG: ABC transporter substrate-binding protein [Proteobacteria bacterium]|nr:ABC transporter substrate-binding protein [Pseudomonadota bacterium]
MRGISTRTAVVSRRATVSGVLSLAFVASRRARAADEITVPYILGLTGGTAAFGSTAKTGAEMAVKAVNERGGIKSLGGAKLRVEIVDHQSKQDIAFNRVKELARRADIPFVMGAMGSGPTITATEAAERSRLPFLVDGSDDDQITSRGFQYLVNLSMPMSGAAANSMKGLRELSDKYGWNLKNVVILIHDDPPGPTALKSIEKVLGQYSFKAIETLRYAESTTDFTPIVAKLRALKPDLTIQQSYPSSALLITKTMAEQHYNPNAVFGIMAGHSLSNYGKELGPAADGTIFTTYWSPDLKFPAAQDFVRRYRDAGHEGVPDPFAAIGYRTVIAAAHILETAASIDREKILKTMKALDVKEGEWPLYPFLGGIKFNDKGENALDEVVIAEWIDGKPRSIWPFGAAGATPLWPKPAWR